MTNVSIKSSMKIFKWATVALGLLVAFGLWYDSGDEPAAPVAASTPPSTSDLMLDNYKTCLTSKLGANYLYDDAFRKAAGECRNSSYLK